MDAITIKQGDSIRWGALWESGGAAVDLTGYEIRCEARTRGGASAGTLAATFTVTLGDQVTAPGTFTMVLADTSTLAVGAYEVDLRVQQPDSDSYASESWQLTVKAPVTARW